MSNFDTSKNSRREVKFFSGQEIPLEMHKVRIVQKVNLLDIKERVKSIDEAGNNTFLLKNRDVFLDMLTDSGVNAMSDKQLAAMMQADDSYAGSETFYRLDDKIKEIFGCKFFLPAHQGRACENIIAEILVTESSTAIMNYHFTTTKAHITRLGGSVVEVPSVDALCVDSDNPFKGNFDLLKLNQAINDAKKVAFVRIELGTNLIGGQPISLSNMREVSKICKTKNIPLVIDASLLADNLYFLKTREEECKEMSLKEISCAIADLGDITYFSARKLGCARGGGIMTSNSDLHARMQELVPLYEGFLTYGGMSVREMEALTVGLEETMDIDVINQTPIFVKAFVEKLKAKGVPVVTPAGGLGCHIDASRFVDHIPQEQYPAGALASALFIVSGIRGMERGTMSEQRNPDNTEHLADLELLRLAMPKRVYTLSQVEYAVDRITWLFEHRHLIGGLSFYEEPSVLRFFFGKLKPTSDWQTKLVEAFLKDMPNGL